MAGKSKPGALEAMLASGQLAELAQGCYSMRELAKRMGVTTDTLEQRIKRIRAAGRYFPTIEELRGGLVETVPPEPVIQKVDNSDFDGDEEPTNPELRIDEAIAARREKLESTTLRKQLGQALAEIERLRLHAEVAQGAAAARGDVPRIELHGASGGLRQATAVAVASDWHIEEKVDAAAVNGVNEYNLEIARKRVARFFSGVIHLIRYHADHFDIRNLLLGLLGDLITGYLREENLESNELSPVQAIATLHVWIADGIREILAALDIELDVVCISGNHGRLTDKIRPSTQEANSIEWLLYVGLAREFANDPRVRFYLPAGQQTYFQVYGTTVRFLHGHGISYGGGVGGILIPINKALARLESVRHADLTVLGHFHQYHDLPDLVVNGSLIGYSPYSLSFGARFEKPRQAFFLIDSRRGKTMPADIWLEDA